MTGFQRLFYKKKLAGVFGRVCLCVRAACTLPILAGVRGACVSVPYLAFTPPILARVLGRLYSCARSACTPPVLAGVCGVGVCAWVLFPAAVRHFWLGCWGVCVCVRAPPVPRLSLLGFVVCVLGVVWHLLQCRGSLRVVRASLVCGTWWPLLLGTCPCVLVVDSGMPPWRAACPRVLRRPSSGPVALGAPGGFPTAVVPVSIPGAWGPGFTGSLRRASEAGP